MREEDESNIRGGETDMDLYTKPVTYLLDALHIISKMGISGIGYKADYDKCVNIAKVALKKYLDRKGKGVRDDTGRIGNCV